MSKFDELVKELVERLSEGDEKNDHPWQKHVKKHIKAHPKGNLGKMGDEETKSFFKKVKGSYGKGHSDEEIKKMHNENVDLGDQPTEGDKEKAGKEKKMPKVDTRTGVTEVENSVYTIYEELQLLRTMSDHQYISDIRKLQTDLLNLGYSEDMARTVYKNRQFMGSK